MRRSAIIIVAACIFILVFYGCSSNNNAPTRTPIPSPEVARAAEETNYGTNETAHFDIDGMWIAYGVLETEKTDMVSQFIPESNLTIIEDDSVAFVIDEGTFEYYGTPSTWSINDNIISLANISQSGLLCIIDQDTINEANRGEIIVYKRANQQPQRHSTEQSLDNQDQSLTQEYKEPTQESQEQSQTNQYQSPAQEGHWKYTTYAEEGALIVDINQVTGEVSYKTVCPICGQASSTVVSRYIMGRLFSEAYCQNNKCTGWNKSFSVMLESKKEWVVE